MLIILFILSFSTLVSQNFIYDSEDWYIVNNPGSIYSITEGPFNVYFGTENGVFLYDLLEDTIQYDFQLNRGLRPSEEVFSIYYDNYSDQIWIITDDGIFYKNIFFDSYNKVNLKNNIIFNTYNFGRIGSIDKYIIIEKGFDLIFIDSFSGSQVSAPSEFNINQVSWNSSFYNNEIIDFDLSKYYCDNWLIGFSTITDRYGNQESVNVSFEDTNQNLWFGTNKGKIIRGYKYSNKVSVLSIGPFKSEITSIAKTNEGLWYIGSGDFKRYGNKEYFKYNKQSKPFLSIWSEKDNSWFLLNEDDFSDLNNPDVNYIHLIEDDYLALGLMEGLLIISLDNYNNYFFIDRSKGLVDSAVFKVVHYKDKAYVMSPGGISVYSLSLNLIVDRNILANYDLDNSDILDMIINNEQLYFSTKSGLYEYDISKKSLIKITDSVFYEIDYNSNKLYGLNHYLTIIDIVDYSESVFYFNTARNFELSDDYVWLNLKDKVKLIHLVTKEKWVYDYDDGFRDVEIYDIVDDGDWICFLTSKGLMFYNWSEYHY